MTLPEKSCKEVFGATLKNLMKEKGLSDRKLQDELEKIGGKYSYPYINRVVRGAIDASTGFIKMIATYFGEDERSLLCIAGKPPEEVLLVIARNPHYFLSLAAESSAIKIGVVEILWAAHIFAVQAEQRDWKVYTRFECDPYETGREALDALIKGEVHFATVTKSAVEQFEENKQVKDIFYILDFLTPRSGSLYYLYTLPDKQCERKFAYLKMSILKEVADEYVSTRGVEERNNIDICGVDTLDELVEAIAKNEIQGFFGWPPLNDKVISKLKKRADEGTANSRFLAQGFEFEEDGIAPSSNLIPTLYLVTTKSFVERAGPAIITDLTSRILAARSKINNLKDNRDYIWDILKEKMPYISDKSKEKLLSFAFDANIEAEAFKLMIAQRMHFATTSQHLFDQRG